MKRIKLIVFVLTVFCSCLKTFANDVEYVHPFKLNVLNESVLLGTGTALVGSSVLCSQIFGLGNKNFEDSGFKKADIPFFDQLLMNHYSPALHYVATGVCALTLLSPVIFATVPNNEWLNIGMMFGEALFLSYGTKEWLKILAGRVRPGMYYSDYPESWVDSNDWNKSFPSGHTTLAFTGAAFTSYVFSQYYPDSKWNYAVTGISFGLAVTTGMLRIFSGNHFFSDVLVGAVIGTVYGFIVPYMHTENYYRLFKKNKKGVSVSATPLSFDMKIRF